MPPAETQPPADDTLASPTPSFSIGEESREHPHQATRLTLVTFGFKYGLPNTNYYFDVSFLKNPARDDRWGLFAKPNAEMRKFVLGQDSCQKFLDSLAPLIRTLTGFDDDVRIGLGCSSGRHRSYIIAEELKQRLENDQLFVRLIHRENEYQ